MRARDEAVVEALAKVGDAYERGVLLALPVPLSPVQVFVLADLLTLVLDHPEMTGDLRAEVVKMGGALQAMFHPNGPATGVLYRYLEAGWGS